MCTQGSITVHKLDHILLVYDKTCADKTCNTLTVFTFYYRQFNSSNSRGAKQNETHLPNNNINSGFIDGLSIYCLLRCVL